MHLRGIGYALTASLMFGLGAVLAQLIGKEIDATLVAFLSLALGGLLLAMLLLLMRISPFTALFCLSSRDWLNLLLLSLLGTALPLLAIVAGFARTSALAGGFLLQVNGIAALFFSLLLLREHIHSKQWPGVLLLLAGSVLVVLNGKGGRNSLQGDLLILLGATGLGFGLIPAKHLSSRIAALPLTVWRLLLGAFILVPLVAIQLIVGIKAHLLLWQPTSTALWALPLYIVSNFSLAYLAQQEGLRWLKAWEIAAIGQTVPLFSTLFALLILHESLTYLQALGGLIVLSGGLIVSLKNGTPIVSAERTVTQTGQRTDPAKTPE